MTTKFGLGADTRLHQDLGSLNRAQRQNYFSRRAKTPNLTILDHLQD